MLNIKTNPYKAVSFNENAIMKAAEKAGSLIAQVKYDCVRLNLVAKHTGGFFLSSTSKIIPALGHLCGYSERWEKFLADERQIYKGGLMIDGEAMIKGVDFNTGSGILRTKWLSKKNVKFTTQPDYEIPRGMGKVPFELDPQHLKVVVYAVLPLDVVESGEDHDVMNCLMPYHVETMLTLLKEYFPEIEWVKAESHDVFSMMQLDKLYEFVRERGWWLVVKDPLDIYKRGKKTGWWKMEPENEADGTIVGLVWGTKGKDNEGKVIGFEVLLESGRVVNATNISQALMEEFTSQVVKASRIAYGYDNFGNTVYEDIQSEVINPYNGWACQITYMEETPDGSLRHPSFDKFRGTEDNPTEKM